MVEKKFLQFLIQPKKEDDKNQAKCFEEFYEDQLKEYGRLYLIDKDKELKVDRNIDLISTVIIDFIKNKEDDLNLFKNAGMYVRRDYKITFDDIDKLSSLIAEEQSLDVNLVYWIIFIFTSRLNMGYNHINLNKVSCCVLKEKIPAECISFYQNLTRVIEITGMSINDYYEERGDYYYLRNNVCTKYYPYINCRKLRKLIKNHEETVYYVKSIIGASYNPSQSDENIGEELPTEEKVKEWILCIILLYPDVYNAVDVYLRTGDIVKVRESLEVEKQIIS